MAPKVRKGKGVAFSSHGSKRARRPSEEEHEDVSMTPPPLRRYGLHWVTKKEDRILTLDLDFMFNASGDCNLNMVREFLVNWMPKERLNQVKINGQIIEFAPKALNRLLGTPNVDPQPFVDMVKKPPYRNIRHTLCALTLLHGGLATNNLDYDPRGVDVTKTKEPEGINGPVLTVNEHNVRIDNMLSHLYSMQKFQLRMNSVTEEQLQYLNIDYPLSEHS
ncbi:hypothetical protein HAX54_036967 [Datura stramonium]|uniref:Uncharacterized protein n=1 Tax=Datura stramonium TaxID=4076 RepID=A0ABS8SHL8_DATST|nr:hypothetical protein [Datura stramonium]